MYEDENGEHTMIRIFINDRAISIDVYENRTKGFWTAQVFQYGSGINDSDSTPVHGDSKLDAISKALAVVAVIADEE